VCVFLHDWFIKVVSAAFFAANSAILSSRLALPIIITSPYSGVNFSIKNLSILGSFSSGLLFRLLLMAGVIWMDHLNYNQLFIQENYLNTILPLYQR
jgi:hypothetical protein